jgi:hypothetical protein
VAHLPRGEQNNEQFRDTAIFRSFAGASSRKATRFGAPSGSPAASARAAAVISESIGIPPHLSLPSLDGRR